MEGSLNDWFRDTDGETRWLNLRTKTLFMPYNLEPESYGEKAKELIESGFVVQLEIV